MGQQKAKFQIRPGPVFFINQSIFCIKKDFLLIFVLPDHIFCAVKIFLVFECVSDLFL